MNYVINHIQTNTPNNRRPRIKMTAEYITLHNTGNLNSNARNERGWLTNKTNNRQASFHIVVDEKEAIECVPLNEVAWHAGDGSGKGNRASVGIEVCESGDYEKTLKNTVDLVAKMLLERGWGVDRLRRHYDWSKKICPRKMYDYGSWKGWFEFLNRVDTKLDILKNGDDEMLNLEQYQWDMLVKKIEKLQDDGEINSSQWLEKAKNKKMSVSDLAWLHFVIDDKF